MFFLFVCVPLCLVYSSEGRKEGVHHLLNELASAGRSGFTPSSAVSQREGDTEIGFGACFSSVS